MYSNVSVNSSCLDDVPPPPFSNVSAHLACASCFRSQASIILFTACSITNLLLIPLFVLALFLGCSGCGRQRPAGKAATASLSDVFTHHSSVKHMISMLAIVGYFHGGFFDLDGVSRVSMWIWTVAEDGQALIHVLTCVERYLAVVKPVTYLNLRRAVGGCFAHLIAGCVWLTSVLYVGVSYVVPAGVSTYMYISSIGCFLSVIMFCSIHVLCTLRAPGPGEVGGNKGKGRGQQCKRRAFYAITAILGTLLFNFGGNTLANVIIRTTMLNQRGMCVELTSFWFSLPSSLVLPLLFFQRERQVRCRRDIPSG